MRIAPSAGRAFVLVRLGVALALATAGVAPAVGAAADASPRHALVIGNSSYKHAPLTNPLNDARAMADSLQRVGFRVVKLENASQPRMHEAIRQFGEMLRAGGVGLFYYAGHGVQVKGRNFLIPVDAAIEREDEVPYKAIDAQQVLDKMESAKNPLNIVVLDACRNNPFARRSRSAAAGLALMEAPVGAIIAFATAPGAEASDGDGKNGIYTQHLLQYMTQPGLKVEDVFKRVRLAVRQRTNGAQIPWENTSLEGDFYFVPPTVAEASATAPPSAKQPPDPKAIELEFWNTIKNSTNPYDYKAYLERFPNGEFAPLARVRAEAATTPRAASDSGPKVADARPTSEPSPSAPPRSSEGFSFSRAEEQAQREWEARQAAASPDLSRIHCSAVRKRVPIKIEISEQYVHGLAVLARQRGGSAADAIVARLRSAGLNVVTSGSGKYVLRGSITSQASSNRLLALTELSINTALTLTDAAGTPVSTVLHREESYAGGDLYGVYAGLAGRQAGSVAAQLYQDFCGQS
jgi:hypothetical protein